MTGRITYKYEGEDLYKSNIKQKVRKKGGQIFYKKIGFNSSYFYKFFHSSAYSVQHLFLYFYLSGVWGFKFTILLYLKHSFITNV